MTVETILPTRSRWMAANLMGGTDKLVCRWICLSVDSARRTTRTSKLVRATLGVEGYGKVLFPK